MDEVHRLFEDLRYKDHWDRWSAVVDIVTHQEPILPAFLEALKDEDLALQRSVIVMIGEMGILSTVPALVEALGDKEWKARPYIMVALSNILSTCKKRTDALEAFETGFSEGFASLRKRSRGMDTIIEVRMGIAKLMIKAAGMRNRLAEKRDILLDDRPKPPSRGMVYQSLGGRPPLRR